MRSALRLSIRLKLTSWYVGMLAVLLLAYSAVVYAAARRTLVASLDRDLGSDVGEVAENLSRVLARPPSTDINEDWWMEIRDERGAVLRTSLSSGAAPAGAIPRDCGEGHPFFYWSSSRTGRSLRAACLAVMANGKHYQERVSVSAESLQAELRRLLSLLLLGLPFGAALAATGGYFLAWRALRPVSMMTRQAERITADRLSERLSVENPGDELGQLARTFNQAFERIGQAFEQTRRFSADASHELRTPLTVIRTLGEVALEGNPDAPALREALGDILEEVDSLGLLVSQLLMLSRADAGQLPLRKEPVDLGQLARDAADHLEVLADEKRQSITARAPAAWVEGDPVFLRRAIVNLLHNAIKFSPEGSQVELRLAETSGRVALDVTDQGPGIPPALHGKIFERFFRADASRSRRQGGTGLGLSIARWVVEAQDGSLRVASEPGAGATFTIDMPAMSRGTTGLPGSRAPTTGLPRSRPGMTGIPPARPETT